MLNHYPDVAGRSELSKSTGLSESQVQVGGYLQATRQEEIAYKQF